jgi:iron complex outermembrane recepter protein
MNSKVASLLRASFLIIATVLPTALAYADDTTPTADVAPGGSPLEEIVVTARRKSENLQNVPVSEQVVTGAVIEQQAITQPSQIADLTPGLTMRLDSPGTPTLILRGIRWETSSGASAIPIYLNDIDFQPNELLQTLYDTEQIEVLRGPQGEARGAPSISGAVTITTRRPDLDSFGGFVYGEWGEGDHRVGQGALNVPIITDMLSIRIAGSVDDSDGNWVRSINNSTGSFTHTTSGRATVLFRPTSDLSFTAMYERLNQNAKFYTQVEGTGSPGSVADPLITPGYNIAPLTSISAGQRVAVQELPNTQTLRTDLFSLNAVWNVLGQKLEYNFGYENDHLAPFTNPFDALNMTIEDDEMSVGTAPRVPIAHHNEVRLSGDNRFFDYAVGFYSNYSTGETNFSSPTPLPGAFGNPFAGPISPVSNPAALARYVALIQEQFELDTQDHSEYANVQFHLPFDTELSGGARLIHDTRPATINILFPNGFALAAPAIAFGGACPAAFGLVASSVYAGYCDAALPNLGEPPIPTQSLAKTYTPVIWNAALSHKFTPDIMAYVTVGTSWRAGLPALGSQGLPASVLFPVPETAKSYELGIKTSFAGRVRLNADIYQINYTNELIADENAVPYIRTDTGALDYTTGGGAFNANIDSRIRGVEADIAYEPINTLTLEANASYSKNDSAGGQIPCDNGVPVTAADPIHFCAQPRGKTLNASAPLQATFIGNYSHPLGPVDGYARLVVDYQGHNPAFGISSTSESAYALVNAFVGLNGNQASWDVGLYAKNLFNTTKVIEQNPLVNTVNPTFGPSGLNQVEVTLPREVGVHIRYAFGSR